MDILIETERFIIRPLQNYDAAGMLAMDSDPEVHRYVGGKPVETIEQTQAVIAFVRSQYAGYGIGRWAVIEKANYDRQVRTFLFWVDQQCSNSQTP